MIFWRIFLIVLLIIVTFIFGVLINLWYVGRMVIIPLCTILFGAVNGKAAEDFCNQCNQTERGTKISSLFYLFYNAGYRCTQNAEFGKFFELAINSKPMVESTMRLIDRDLVVSLWSRDDNG